MSTMCKTDKGTLEAWSFGNHWGDSDTWTTKGISIGIYGSSSTIAKLEYNETTNSLTLIINKKIADARDINIKMIDEDWR